MPRSSDPETSQMTVFRPRRRCVRCGLVNADGASRCRRCGASFADVNPGAESERLVARIRSRRYMVAGGVVVILVGFLFAGLAYQSRAARVGAYDDLSHAVRTDIVALGRAARSDATLITGAFNDGDVRSLLRDQSGQWTDRLRQCERLQDKLEELIPQNENQAANEMALERDLAAIQSASRELAQAAEKQDVFSARVAASRLAASPDEKSE